MEKVRKQRRRKRLPAVSGRALSEEVGGICKGCIEADGYVSEWAGSGRCKVHACARNHGVQFCGLCAKFPCKNSTTLIHWDPNIKEHLSNLAKQYQIQKEQKIIKHIDNGAKIVMVRATNVSAGRLYEKVGFKAYNYAI